MSDLRSSIYRKWAGVEDIFLALFWVIENNSFFGSLYYIDRMEMVSIFIVLSILDVYFLSTWGLGTIGRGVESRKEESIICFTMGTKNPSSH